jgi:hypothetical protein
MSSTSLNEQKDYLHSLLLKLSGLIKKIPTTLPCGSKEGPIAKHFSDLKYDTTEGPYYTFNKSWERVFQCPDDEKEHLIVRVWLGFGTGLSCPFFEYFGDQDEWRATVDGTADRGINLCDRDNVYVLLSAQFILLTSQQQKGQRPEDDHSTFKYSKETKLRKTSPRYGFHFNCRHGLNQLFCRIRFR